MCIRDRLYAGQDHITLPYLADPAVVTKALKMCIRDSPTRAFGVSMDTLFRIAEVLQIPASKLFED